MSTMWQIKIAITNTITLATRYLFVDPAVNAYGNTYVGEWTDSAADRGYVISNICTGKAWNHVTPFSIVIDTLPFENISTGTIEVVMSSHIYQFPNPLPVGSTWSYTCEGFEIYLMPAKASKTEFKSVNTIDGVTEVASTKELDMGTVKIGDGPDDYSRSRIMVYDGAKWYNSLLWGVGSSTDRKNINQLSTEQCLLGQRFPVEKYQGSFMATSLTPCKAIVWDNKTFVPIRISMTGQADMVDGEWFNCEIPT